VNKRGKQQCNGKQRYLCRDCKKIWTDGPDGRVKHSEEKKITALRMYLEGMGIRSLERILKVCNSQIIGWIRKYGEQVKEQIKRRTEEIINTDSGDLIKNHIEMLEIDEIVTYIKKNLKNIELKEKMEKTVTKEDPILLFGLPVIGIKNKLLILKWGIGQR
jgi:transposase-like protein